MTYESFDWMGGHVTFWSLSYLDDDKSVHSQLDHLTEDLGLVEYTNGALIDVSWLPECAADGRFVVLVIANDDWDAPLSLAETTSIHELATLLRNAIQLAQQHQSG